MTEFPKKLATEAETRRVIASLEADLAGSGWSVGSRVFMRKLLAGHKRYLAEFIAAGEVA